MEYNLKKDSVSFIKTLYDGNSEQGIDTQISLPEYCRDVERILKCFVEPNISSCRITGDRVTADGEAVIRVLYLNDKGAVECYEQSVPLSKFVEVRELDSECSATAKATGEYVNCRALSQRRLTVNGNISIHFCVKRLSSVQVASCAEGCGVETRKELLNVDIPVSQCGKMFEIGETAEIQSPTPPVSAIIRTEAVGNIDTVKCIDGKMLVKGEMCVGVFYKADDEDGSLVHFDHTMPLSQIVEMSGIDENSVCDCAVPISCVNVSARSDSKGENRLLDVSVKAFVCADAYNEKEVTLIKDSYSTEYEVRSEFKSVEFTKYIDNFLQTENVRSTVDMSNLNVGEIIDTSVLKTECVASAQSEKITASGNAIIGILYKNTSDEYGYTERTADFTFNCPVKENNGEITAVPTVNVSDISCMAVGSDKAEIKMNVKISMAISKHTHFHVCTDLEPDESRVKSQDMPTVTVYFTSAGEEVWDIARNYNTTVEAIKGENDLISDTVEEKTVLMIPRA